LVGAEAAVAKTSGAIEVVELPTPEGRASTRYHSAGKGISAAEAAAAAGTGTVNTATTPGAALRDNSSLLIGRELGRYFESLPSSEKTCRGPKIFRLYRIVPSSGSLGSALGRWVYVKPPSVDAAGCFFRPSGLMTFRLKKTSCRNDFGRIF